MQKKIAKTLCWIIGISISCGLWKLINYQIDMYYSQVAAEQFENDNSYSLLRTHNAITDIILIIAIFVILFFLNKIRKIWFTEG